MCQNLTSPFASRGYIPPASPHHFAIRRRKSVGAMVSARADECARNQGETQCSIFQ